MHIKFKFCFQNTSSLEMHMCCIVLEVHQLKKVVFFYDFDGLLLASLTKNSIKNLIFLNLLRTMETKEFMDEIYEIY